MVHGNINEPQLSEVRHSLRQLTGEGVVIEFNLSETRHLSELTRDRSIEFVPGEVEELKVSEVSDGVRDGAHKVTIGEPECFEIGQVSEGEREGGREEGVVREVKRFEGGDVEERG